MSSQNNSRHDGNISYVIDGMVARVIWTNGKSTELFSSNNWEEAQEKYTEAIMLRDISCFQDAENIRQRL